MAGAFAEPLTAGLNGNLVGLYLVGSYVLGDLQHDSDVDFLAVLGAEPSRADIEHLRSLHTWMCSRYPERRFEGFYAFSQRVLESALALPH